MMESFQVDLKLPYHKVLNPKLWDGNELKPEVSKQLKLIAKAFLDYCELPVEVKEMNFVGSNAGFIWDAKSDIDLNILIDMSKFKDPKITHEYFDVQKKVFKRDHKIRIFSIPVEITVDDLGTDPKCEGVWSLTNNKWIREPVYSPPEYQEEKAEKIADKWHDRIIGLVRDKEAKPEKLDDLRQSIKDTRTDAIAANGDKDPVNLAYKTLRHGGYIDLLKNTIRDRITDKLSLKK